MRSLKRIGFGALVAVVLGMAVLNILVWQGILIRSDSGTPGAKSSTTSKKTSPERLAPAPTPTSTATTTTTTTTTTTQTTPAPPQPANGMSTIVLTATRGDCWIVARSGSARGPVLYQAVLRRSTSTRLRAKQLWLSLGAAANVDVTVDGKPADVPGGTVEVVLPKTHSA